MTEASEINRSTSEGCSLREGPRQLQICSEQRTYDWDIASSAGEYFAGIILSCQGIPAICACPISGLDCMRSPMGPRSRTRVGCTEGQISVREVCNIVNNGRGSLTDMCGMRVPTEGTYICRECRVRKDVSCCAPQGRQAGYPGVTNIVASIQGSPIEACCLAASPRLHCSLLEQTLKV